VRKAINWAGWLAIDIFGVGVGGLVQRLSLVALVEISLFVGLGRN
jgi:hypothetical protein